MSYNKIKTDPHLGQKVHEYLVSVGVETPVTKNGLSSKEKIDKIVPEERAREEGDGVSQRLRLATNEGGSRARTARRVWQNLRRG